MTHRILLLTVALLAGSSLTHPVPASTTESTSDFLTRYIESCLDGGDLECLQQFWVADKIPNVRKSEEFRRSFFPDLAYEILEIFVDGERAAVVLSVTGTHQIPGPKDDETPPSHQTLDTEEVVLYSIRDGLIRRGQVIGDNLDIAKALGYRVLPPDSE